MHREVCDGSALSSPNISPYANLSLTSRIHPGVERPLNLAWRPYGPKAKGEESRRPNEIENQNAPHVVVGPVQFSIRHLAPSHGLPC